MDQKILLNEIIQGYRNVIKEKYDYENLKKRSDIPDVYTKEVSVKIKNYFLNYSYPGPKKRQELNEAFQSLDSYLMNPEKLLRIVIDSASIVFKYGKHLPKIVNAGIKALKAFRRASKLEHGLVKKASSSDVTTPYTNQQINDFIKELSSREIEEYISSTYNLFQILCDVELMSKIKNVLNYLTKKMKNRPAIYTANEIKGLEIGQEIIVEADAIFNKLDKDEQQEIFDFIMKMEKELLGLS
jgi:hypothetical protein